MRTTLAMMGQQSVFRLQRSFDRMSLVRAELTSGKRIHSWSVDPLGMGMARRYQGLLDRNEEYLRGAATARTFLDGADAVLRGMGEQLVRLRELVLQQSSEALANDETQAATRREVLQLRDAVLGLANQEIEGEHIFAGYRSDQPPFRLEGETVVYRGGEAAPRVRISSGLLMEVSLPGSELMGSPEARLAGSTDLRPRLEVGTDLSALDRGRGFAGGGIRLVDGLGNAVTVDLSAATTVGDVLTTVNAAASAAGVDLSVRIADDGAGLLVEGTGPWPSRRRAARPPRPWASWAGPRATS